MTYEEHLQYIRSTALNKIRKIYHPKSKFPYSQYETEDGNRSEQRDVEVRYIIERMEKDLEALKEKRRSEGREDLR